MAALDESLAAAEPIAAREETPLRRFVAEFAASKLAVLGLVVFILIAIVAIFAPWIAPTARLVRSPKRMAESMSRPWSSVPSQ